MERADSIGVYWGPRKESASECADRLAAYLLGLGKQHALLSQWYLKQRSRKAAKVPVDLTGEELLHLIAGGSNRQDMTGDVMESLGFRVGLWNGLDDDQSVGLSIKCGLHEQTTNLGNAVVLTLSASESSELADVGLLKRCLLCGVDSWQPDWGAIFFSGSEVLEQRVGNGPFLDQVLWMKGGDAGIAGAARRENLRDGVLLER